VSNSSSSPNPKPGNRTDWPVWRLANPPGLSPVLTWAKVATSKLVVLDSSSLFPCYQYWVANFSAFTALYIIRFRHIKNKLQKRLNWKGRLYPNPVCLFGVDEDTVWFKATVNCNFVLTNLKSHAWQQF
jgi:hypothetical protein